VDQLADAFESHRTHLRGVAYRMLGTLTEAEDAVQETWLRLNRSDTASVDNLAGWLTTVLARVCLDMLRARKSRREQPIDDTAPAMSAADPEREAVLADSVGLALMVVLDNLEPPERIAFVLHDMFALPFEEIAAIVGRSPAATRQLASRARRRVRGAAPAQATERARQREVVNVFLAALKAGDFDALLSVLDPDVTVRIDPSAVAAGASTDIRGAENWARNAIAFARGAKAAQLAIVDGDIGIVVAPRGRLFRALKFTIADGRIKAVDVVAEPERLRRLGIGVLDSGKW